MTQDIVARLREYAKRDHLSLDIRELCHAAADLIERLQAPAGDEVVERAARAIALERNFRRYGLRNDDAWEDWTLEANAALASIPTAQAEREAVRVAFIEAYRLGFLEGYECEPRYTPEDNSSEAYIRLDLHEAAISASTHSPDLAKVVEEEASFLLERIEELDWSLEWEGFQREWYGHVEPSLGRLRQALVAPSGERDAMGEGRKV